MVLSHPCHGLEQGPAKYFPAMELKVVFWSLYAIVFVLVAHLRLCRMIADTDST